MTNRALFLDRDGILNRELGRYVVSVEDLNPVPGAFEMVVAAKEKGYKIIVLTNQPQVGSGLLDVEELDKIHALIQERLGGLVDKFYYCPHTDQDGCDCRKPKAGMLRRAIKEFNIDGAESIFVGDSDKDILAGQAIGCKTIFVKNEFNSQHLEKCSPDDVVESPGEVIRFILKE